VLASIDIAIRKASTAVLFQANSESVWDYCKPGAPAPGLELTNGGLAPFGGGIPPSRWRWLVRSLAEQGQVGDERDVHDRHDRTQQVRGSVLRQCRTEGKTGHFIDVSEGGFKLCSPTGLNEVRLVREVAHAKDFIPILWRKLPICDRQGKWLKLNQLILLPFFHLELRMHNQVLGGAPGNDVGDPVSSAICCPPSSATVRPPEVWNAPLVRRGCAKQPNSHYTRYLRYPQGRRAWRSRPNQISSSLWPIWAVDAGGSVIVGLPGVQQKPKRSPKGRSALLAVSRPSQVVAELIPLEFEDKPPTRRAAPASTAVKGRTGFAVFSAGLVVLSPRLGLTS
jgi:Haem degrading protein HbpS-like